MQVLNDNGQQGFRIMLSLSSSRALFNVKQYKVNYDRIRVLEDFASVSTGRAFTMLCSTCSYRFAILLLDVTLHKAN